jgi:DNA-binding NarL/FixJ family response regulator
VRAELGRLEGEDAPAPWQVAAEAWEPLAEPHPAAYARIRLAEAILLTGGERAAAGRELATAHATAARLGAVPLLEQAQTLARRARLSLDAPAPAPASDGAGARLGLTAREAEVLALLAEGLTNREIATRLFISQKTVASHLAHIFDKLDVHSRVEAAGRAHQLQLVQGVAASTPDG